MLGLLIFFLVTYLVFKFLFLKEKVTSTPQKRVLKKKSPLYIKDFVPAEEQKHGHRCYSEGLYYSEERIVSILSHGLSHKEYFIFNNLIIPSGNSRSTQIDHIIVSRYGIFVIETKEFNGWVFAHPNREDWTVTYPTGLKHHFKNPVWQNYGHKEALKKVMPFIENNFFEAVVFTGQTTFKTPRIEGVLYDSELITFIKKYSKPIISEQRLLMAIGKLAYMCQAIDITPEQHLENIKEVLKID